MPVGKKQKGKAKPTEKPSLLAEEEMVDTNGESSGEEAKNPASKPAVTRYPKRAKRDTVREKMEDPLTSQPLETLPIQPSSESVADSDKELEEVEGAPHVTTRARGGGKKAKKAKQKDKEEETCELEAEITEDSSRGGEKKVQASSKRGKRKKNQKETVSPHEETKMVEEQEKDESVQQGRSTTVQLNEKDELASKETDIRSQEFSTTKAPPGKGSKRGSQRTRGGKESSGAATTGEVAGTVVQGAEARCSGYSTA